MLTNTDGTGQSSDYEIRQVKSFDANGNLTITKFDDLGRTVEVDPPTGPSVNYTYDFLDRLTNVNYGGALSTFVYDYAGRKLSMSDPDMGYWTYSYDALNLARQTDAKGQRICFYYDALNRLTGKHYRSNDSCPTSYSAPGVVYGYDAGTNGIGQRTSMNDASGSANWTYDTRGRMETETKVVNGAGGGTFLTQWQYNSADQIMAINYPSDNSGHTGEQVNYFYHSQDVIDSVIGNATYVNGTDYDASGRITSRGLGTNLASTYNFYPWDTQGGRLQYLKAGTTSNPTSLLFFEYNYNLVGNINWIKDYKVGSPQTQSFNYDSANRLTQASASGGSFGIYSESYTYNSTTGNLQSKTGMGNYTYDANHKHAVASTSNGWLFEYDANGNMVGKHSNVEDLTLTYDMENRLTNVTLTTDVIFGDGFELGISQHGAVIRQMGVI